MISQISNTATKEAIEQILNAKFIYGHLYKPQYLINGLKESTVCIVTSRATDIIQFAIWGILPKGYKESWKRFQTYCNTLEIEVESITESPWLHDALKWRKCLIIATGYFSVELDHKILHTYHITSKNQDIICFAGLYNILEDGFISCGILTRYDRYSKYLLTSPKPIIIKQTHYKNYLKSNLSITAILNNNFEIDPEDLLKKKTTKHKMRRYKKNIKM